MSTPAQWPRRSEWLNDYRQEPRWCDGRTATVRVGNEEYLAKTRDISPRGLCLAVKGVRPSTGCWINVDVVFEGEIKDFGGQVVYALSKPWGSQIGIQCEAGSSEIRDFLSRRYGWPSEGLGSVK